MDAEKAVTQTFPGLTLERDVPVYANEQGETTPARSMGVGRVKELIAECTDWDVLKRLIADDKRKTVRKAAQVRLDELSADGQPDMSPPPDDSVPPPAGTPPEAVGDPDAEQLYAMKAGGSGQIAFSLANRVYHGEITRQTCPAVRSEGTVIDQHTELDIELRAYPGDLSLSQYFNCGFITAAVDEEPAGEDGEDGEVFQEDIEGGEQQPREGRRGVTLPNPGGAQRIGITDRDHNVQLTSLVNGGQQHTLTPRSITWLGIEPDKDKSNTHPTATLHMRLCKLPHEMAGACRWLMGKWMIRFVLKEEEQRNDEQNAESHEENPAQATVHDALQEAASEPQEGEAEPEPQRQPIDTQAGHDAEFARFWELIQPAYDMLIEFAGAVVGKDESKEWFDEAINDEGYLDLPAIADSTTLVEMMAVAEAEDEPVGKFNCRALAWIIEKHYNDN